MSTLGKDLQQHPYHRGRKPGRKPGTKNRTFHPEEYFQDRAQINKWTYEKALAAYKSTSWINRMSFAHLVSVFEHRRLCDNKYYNRFKGQRVFRRKGGCGSCAEDREWVESDNIKQVFSFVECCNRVGVEPSLLRQRYTEWKTQGVNDGQEGILQSAA